MILTNADSFLDVEILENLVTEGYIAKETHSSGRLFLYHYTNKAVNTWTPSQWPEEALYANGLILDDDHFVIARPIKKFFTWQEYEGTVPTTASRKIYEIIDGIPGVLYRDPDGNLAIATRDSFDDDIAKYATELFHRLYAKMEIVTVVDEYTPCFSMVWPEAKQTVDYGDYVGFYLLTAIHKHNGAGLRSAKYSELWGGRCPKSFYPHNFDGMEAIDDESQGRGMILSYDWEFIVQLSFDNYLGMDRMIADISARKIWESLSGNGNMADMLERTPPEFYDWVIAVKDELWRKFSSIKALAIDIFDKVLEDDPAMQSPEFSANISQETDYRTILWKMFHQQEYNSIIWQMVKPKPEIPYKQAKIVRPTERLMAP